MTVTLRAYFDGKVLVPDEPVMLPQGTPLTVRVDTPVSGADSTPDQQRAAFEAFLARAAAHPVPQLPDEATRREAIYED